MNSFESDLRRAVISVPFFLGVILEFIIMVMTEFDSDLFRLCVPVLATFPYSTAWLLDYQSGFVKTYLSRTGINPYIIGKISACGISGGLLEVMGCFLYSLTKSGREFHINFSLIFMSGMLWAVLSAALAAWSNSRYIAYGGAFVIYYLMVILHDRYFQKLYCLYPYEWLNPQHVWVFEEQGIIIQLFGITVVFACFYYWILRRCIEHA